MSTKADIIIGVDEHTHKLPEFKPPAAQPKRAKRSDSVFERELKPISSPDKSGKQIIAEMKKLSDKDIFTEN